jgi:Ca2+-binding EF-hand superfamily protein
MSGHANREAIEAEFKAVDVDGSGDLSLAEIRHNMESMYGEVRLTDQGRCQV